MPVIGIIVIVVAILILLPLGFWMAWAVMGWVLSESMTDNAEATHQGSDLIDTNT